MIILTNIKRLFKDIKIKFLLIYLLIKEQIQTTNKYKNSDDKKRISDYYLYKQMRKPKGVVYTCITNNYDDIHEIEIYKYIDKDWDYVFFTDNQEQIKQGKIGIWEVKPLHFTDLDNTRNNRWHKLNPHILFPEYKQSIYIDANIVPLTSYLFDIIEKRNKNFLLPTHYKNDCIYSEYKDILKLKLDKKELVNKELSIIKNSGMPRYFGFCENNILYRKHNEEIIKNLDEEWWNFVKNYSKRDQLSLCYLLWKYKFNIKQIMINNTRVDSKNFYVITHKKTREKYFS